MYQNIISLMAHAAGGTVSDSDAQAFITTAGITDTTQKNAINQLVIDLKAASIWTKMTALYPFVGGDATKHSYNLKNSAAYQITWNGTLTHNANGVTGNGSTGYGDTNCNPVSAGLSLADYHLSFYSRTSADSSSSYDIGSDNASSVGALLVCRFFGAADMQFGAASADIFITNADGKGFYIGSRRSNTDEELYKNGATLGNDTDSQAAASLPSINVYVCGRNHNGSITSFSSRNCALASIGTGLTDADVSAYYTAVQTFQTSLGRQV